MLVLLGTLSLRAKLLPRLGTELFLRFESTLVFPCQFSFAQAVTHSPVAYCRNTVVLSCPVASGDSSEGPRASGRLESTAPFGISKSQNRIKTHQKCDFDRSIISSTRGSRISRSAAEQLMFVAVLVMMASFHRFGSSAMMMSSTTQSSDAIRIFCFGDSLTAGTSPPEFATYPYAPHLEAALHDRGLKNVIVRH